jgi:hypothetical protein
MQEAKIIKNDEGVEFTPLYAIEQASSRDKSTILNHALLMNLKIEKLFGKAKDGRERIVTCVKTEQVQKLVSKLANLKKCPKALSIKDGFMEYQNLILAKLLIR